MKSFFLKLIYFKEKYPLQLVLVVAAFVRIIAVIYAKGFISFDEYNLIIDPAGNWAHGIDYKEWLPWTEGNQGPYPINLFYVGFVWGLFETMQFLGLDDPANQMTALRLLHAILSMFTVYYGFRIAEKLGNKYSAFQVGMILALLALFPHFSVRQLSTMVCIPPLMASYWFIIKTQESKRWINIILAGVFAGLAVGLRYQLGIFYVGIGVVLLFDKKWLELLLLTIVAGLVFFLTQLSDLFLWNKPFVQLSTYIQYHLRHQNEYLAAPWYQYIYAVIGFLIPPVSFFLLFGFLRSWKKHVLFVLPTLLFFGFHSIFPIKQAHFILPVLPIIITIGVIGWNEWLAVSRFWINYYRLNRLAWIFFWLINTLFLVFFTTAYTNRQFVEPLTILKNRGDAQNIIVEDSYAEKTSSVIPWFYLNNWENNHVLWNQQSDSNQLQTWMQSREPDQVTYILFLGSTAIEKRVKSVEAAIGNLQEIEEVKPGTFDIILSAFHLQSQAESTYIYQLKKP